MLVTSEEMFRILPAEMPMERRSGQQSSTEKPNVRPSDCGG